MAELVRLDEKARYLFGVTSAGALAMRARQYLNCDPRSADFLASQDGSVFKLGNVYARASVAAVLRDLDLEHRVRVASPREALEMPGYVGQVGFVVYDCGNPNAAVGSQMNGQFISLDRSCPLFFSDCYAKIVGGEFVFEYNAKVPPTPVDQLSQAFGREIVIDLPDRQKFGTWAVVVNDGKVSIDSGLHKVDGTVLLATVD